MSEFPEIPGCKILRLLGKGGMGSVYLGIQEKLERKVAIKVLKPSLLEDKMTAVRFEREARTAASLSHSNIVQIFDTGESGDYHYIVMEYLEESLKDRLMFSPGGKLHPQIALDIVEDMMKALDYAHFRRIFHRDIKPDNIMFKQDGTPVLVDFGIARVFDSPERLTNNGASIGTSFYMSPEQCQTLLDIDGRTDIYSLGVVLYEMLTGEKPYKGDTHISVLLQQINEPVPKLPEELKRYQPLIDRMMAKNREERISRGTQFVQLLDRVLTDTPPQRPQSTKTPPPPKEEPIVTKPEEPPSSLPEEEPAAPPPKKKVKNEKPFINKYFDIADKKTRQFIKDKVSPVIEEEKQKLIEKLVGWLKGKWKLFKLLSPVEKSIILAIPVVLLLVLSVLIFRSSPGTTQNPILNPPSSSAPIERLINIHPQYILDTSYILDLCYLYISRANCPDCLEKAERVINDLKSRKFTPETRRMAREAVKYFEDIKFNI